jgi:hypothetical protein
MLRSEVLNRLLELYVEPAYLEIGVDTGATFFAISAAKKVAVDPAFKFPLPRGDSLSGNVQFYPMPSDEFFAIAPRSELFDVIFIDGLHTFEQTLRDFINATHFLKPDGVIVVDDVKPSSYYASLPNLEESVKVRTATRGKDGDWMGDVYKLVYFIDTFFQQYSFATVAENHGQMIVWRRRRPAASIADRSLEWIARAAFAQVILDEPYRIEPLSQIIKKLSSNEEAADVVSCDPQNLYSKGGYYDPKISLERLCRVPEARRPAITSIGELFPGEAVSRSLPVGITGCSAVDKKKLEDFYTDLNARFEVLPPSRLVKISKAAVWNNMLFCDIGGTYVPLYENYRWCERNLPHIKFSSAAFENSQKSKMDRSGGGYLFIGSAGSFNYGHWLIDDFPRYSALRSISGMGLAPILVLSRFNPAIDKVRENAAALNDERYDVVFVDPKVVYEFDEIYFATPVSYHPVLKSRMAIEYVRAAASTFVQNSPSGPSRLFVNRSSRWPRRITNEDEIKPVLADFGFEEIFPEHMSFDEQRQRFKHASHIAGIMGGAMANTAFSSAAAKILYLAPDGWTEPFFWDLAAVKNQAYEVIFGPAVDDGHKLFQRSFSVNPALLKERLAKMFGGQ